MDILVAFINLIKSIFLPITSFIMGRKSKENEILKKENEKLKKYKKIDKEEINEDIYNSNNW